METDIKRSEEKSRFINEDEYCSDFFGQLGKFRKIQSAHPNHDDIDVRLRNCVAFVGYWKKNDWDGFYSENLGNI